MKSAWVERDAKAAVDHWAKSGVAADLALRVYSTRLLGRDPKLVLHGGGNTSVKTRIKDLLGEDAEVLCVKGSGWDMANIEPAGMPAVRLEPLRKLRGRTTMLDEDMVRVQRAGLVDPQAPNPSVETLLHAFVPHKFVDHTHATAILSFIDQADSEVLCTQTFGNRLGFVPYIMPGFALAKKAAEVFEKNPNVDGLILDKHGIFTFGNDAREAYERMIEFVTLAEDHLRMKGNAQFARARVPDQIAAASEVAPIIRGACTLRNAFGEGAHKRLILNFRSNDMILNYVSGKDVARYARAGLITPDHVIRTKPWPLIVPAPEVGKLDDFKNAVQQAARAFMEEYAAYFTRQKTRANGAAMHDPLPRVVLVPGLGLFGLGGSAKDAAIAADIAENTVDVIGDAERMSSYRPISEDDQFEVEYWSLEQAKLGKAAEKKLARQVAAITGGGAIPDTADYDVVEDPTGNLVGRINEDYAVESMAGDIFLLGNKSWRIKRVESGRLRVIDAQGAPPTIPFWLGEAPARTAELSEAVAQLREEVACRLRGPVRVDDSNPSPSGRGQVRGSDIGRSHLIETPRVGDVPCSNEVAAQFLMPSPSPLPEGEEPRLVVPS